MFSMNDTLISVIIGATIAVTGGVRVPPMPLVGIIAFALVLAIAVEALYDRKYSEKS